MTGATIRVRNVNQALPQALDLLQVKGIWKGSRNGRCIQFPGPVVTVYDNPWERVIFWHERDANPFFHLYEPIWMLAGRNDVASVAYFARQMLEYSDDGETLYGAYGHRWINHFVVDSHVSNVRNQLDMIVKELKRNPESRRAVLQMWDPEFDLGHDGKDVPCNLVATFQILENKLEMVVFCRSNDIIWGAYGANVVHFSMLQEYITVRLGIANVTMGSYYQVSVNFHAYEKQYDKLQQDYSASGWDAAALCPYTHGEVDTPIPITEKTIELLPEFLDNSISNNKNSRLQWSDAFANTFDTMMFAHHLFKILPSPDRFTESLAVLQGHQHTDWCRAGFEWLMRRYKRWEKRMHV